LKYDLAEGFEPGRYAVGEGFILEATGNEMTEQQAAPFIEAGIFAGVPSSEPEPEPAPEEEEPEEGDE
jgi:hypothetical protein